MGKNNKEVVATEVVLDSRLPQGHFLTETDRVKNAVREKFAKQVAEMLLGGKDYELANDKSYLIPIAQDVNGKKIFARVQIAITAQDTFSTKSGAKKATTETVDIPDLNL